MEQVDIVDNELNVIDIVSKEKAHDLGLLHKTVIAEVINSKDEMLLVRQASHKQDAGQYVSPVGGHVKSGESVEEALIRESAEEIGLIDFDYTFIGKFVYNRVTRGKKENHYFHIFEIHADITPVLNDESDSYKWFSKAEITRRLLENRTLFGDAFIPIWENYYLSLNLERA